VQTDVSKAFQQHKDEFDTANVMYNPLPCFTPLLTPASGSACGTRGAQRYSIFISSCCSPALHVAPFSRRACCLQVNPQLYSAFRMPGSVEYEDKDKKAQAVKYGPKADEGESSLKEGERCPGFPFNPHRE
jgi:hypothetical protein